MSERTLARRFTEATGSSPADWIIGLRVAKAKELLETTDWDSFGRGKDPRCDNCMAHCGYEPTAVLATMDSLRESLRAMVSH